MDKDSSGRNNNNNNDNIERQQPQPHYAAAAKDLHPGMERRLFQRAQTAAIATTITNSKDNNHSHTVLQQR
jgi:hypothetical protein